MSSNSFPFIFYYKNARKADTNKQKAVNTVRRDDLFHLIVGMRIGRNGGTIEKLLLANYRNN